MFHSKLYSAGIFKFSGTGTDGKSTYSGYTRNKKINPEKRKKKRKKEENQLILSRPGVAMMLSRKLTINRVAKKENISTSIYSAP